MLAPQQAAGQIIGILPPTAAPTLYPDFNDVIDSVDNGLCTGSIISVETTSVYDDDCLDYCNFGNSKNYLRIEEGDEFSIAGAIILGSLSSLAIVGADWYLYHKGYYKRIHEACKAATGKNTSTQSSTNISAQPTKGQEMELITTTNAK